MLSVCNDTALRLALLVMALTASAAAAKSPLDQAFTLQQQGKLKEARNLYHAAADQYRASGDQRNLAKALSSAGDISISLGEYDGAIADVEQAVKLRQALHENVELGTDLNTIGLAYEYLGNYPAALEHYQEALKFDRMQADSLGEIKRLNNIGNIHYYQARYVAALESYQDALKIVNETTNQPWNPWQRKLTNGNIAALYQRLGLEERALELYQQSPGKPEWMPVQEYARLLLNEGVLYRHLGDPIKALEVYQDSQTFFRTARYSDGEIGVLRNVGIVKTMDLGDLRGALKAFQAALRLSEQTSNQRGVVLANLYLGEILRRLHEHKEAAGHLTAALEAAQKTGLAEEQWKALYALGLIAEERGDPQTARADYQKAISMIESVRAGLQMASLKSDFLADKRDVYDSLIALQLQQPVPATDELFHWMERSRARNLLDRMVADGSPAESDLRVTQSRLRPDTVLVEFWIGKQSGIAVWVTEAASGVVRYDSADDIRTEAARFLAAVQQPGDGWKDSSRTLGAKLFTGIPLRRHLIVAPDGPLNIPFEVLGIPGTEGLLIERSDISYLPSARFLDRAKASGPKWLWPWSRQLVAIGDPPVLSTDTLAENEQWQPLPASAVEVRNIAGIIPGRAEVHLGADARKAYLLGQRLEGLPLLHLSSHALIDAEHPDHSRILLASDSAMTGDYLFQEEVNHLDLANVGLVTLSACDTARGKIVAGEGIQAFSQALLGAGASSTVTSMWQVADTPTASFMSQFYDSLGNGVSKAEALRAAKLHFFQSNSALSSPRHWAAFVLSGEGWTPTTTVISWSFLVFVVAAAVALTGFVVWFFLGLQGREASAKYGTTVPAASSPRNPNVWTGASDEITR
jgi:tetratricopeptide (TPR) repeat protein